MRLDVILLFVSAIFCACLSSDAANDFDDEVCPVAECINSGNSDVSSIILCNRCMAKIISNNDATMIFHEAQRRAHSNTRKRLIDLNADVLSLIVDQLDILSMLNLLDVYRSGILSSVATMSFRRRFKIPVHTESNTQLCVGSHYDGKSIIKSSPYDVARMLRQFRGVTEHLVIKHSPTILSQYVNKFASDSLITLDIQYLNNDTFSYFTKPFTRLEELLLRDEIIGPHLPLDQIFPNLRKLSLNAYYDTDFSFIFCKFPLLEHFFIDHPFKTRNETLLNNFFEKNPQIRSLKLSCLTQNMCNAINNHLTNVENMTIFWHNFDIENDTTFDHVKNFQVSRSMTSREPASIKRLFFPLLESIKIEYSYQLGDFWPDFCRKHKNVTFLEIVNIERDSQLIKVIDQLPSVREITLKYARGNMPALNSRTITKIIERPQAKLQKLKLLDLYYYGAEELDKVREKFENDWNIDAEYYRRSSAIFVEHYMNLSIEKKN